MNDAEAKGLACFLLDCTQALREPCTTREMVFHLHRLYQVIPQAMAAPPHRSNRAERVVLGMLIKTARRRRRQIEERLGVRN